MPGIGISLIPVFQLLLASAGGAAPAAENLRHPLHTTIADVVHDTRAKTLRLSVRVFADDFVAVVPQRSTHDTAAVASGRSREWDAAALRYFTELFSLQYTSGQLVRLEPCGVERSGDVFIICALAREVAVVRGIRVRNTMLFEKFTDQLSIVRVRSGTRSQTLILSVRAPAGTIR